MAAQFGTLRFAGGETQILTRRVTLIGRAPSCHVVIKHGSASKEHCVIEFDDRNNASIKDLDSLNGTYLNDQRLKNGQTLQIFEGDVLMIGQDPNKISFVQHGSSQAQGAGNRHALQKVNGHHDGNASENQKRVDKDYKISVVDYSFRDNSFSRAPLQCK